MGGYGSTRWNLEPTRKDTDWLLFLDVRCLKRHGYLEPGTVKSIGCALRGQSSGNIMIRAGRDGDCLTLEYRTKAPYETEWTPRRQLVWLETTPCQFGGHQVWFTCPGCQRRRAVLFSVGGVFRCRGCHDLAYTSTREGAMDRSYRRIRTLQQRLGGGGSGVPVWEIPDKPARMHWRTYDRLARELQAEQARNGVLFTERLRKLADRLDGLDAD